MDERPSRLRTLRQWMHLGIGIKRWLPVMIIGAILVGMGFVYLLLIIYRSGLMPDFIYDWLMLGFLPLPWRVIIPLVVGALLIFLAIARVGANLVEPFRRPGDSLAASLYDYSRRSRGPHVVAIGGGTGLPALLRGLKQYTSNVTAIVTVADDGGSSGRLRNELGMLPPGDFRNNLAALSRDEGLMTQVLQYRFGGSVEKNGNGELRGHAFGNLLLAALTGITGSFDEALLAAERVLAMRGRVLPSTLELVTLVAEMNGDQEERVSHRVVGESAIPLAGGTIRRVYLEPAGVRAYPPAVQAILRAELVVIGPGSLFTSILPNLLVQDVAQALRHTRAPKAYVCNLATQPGETDGYSVADHVEVVLRHIGEESLDIVIANNNFSVSPQAVGQTIFVQPSHSSRFPAELRLIESDLLDPERPWRHDSQKLARAVRRLLENGEN